MAPLLVRRRPDGVTQIRRLRASDVVLTADTKTLFMLFGGFVTFTVLLFMTLVFDPPLLAVGLWAIVAVAVDMGRFRSGSRRAPRPPVLRVVSGSTPPPPRGAP